MRLDTHTWFVRSAVAVAAVKTLIDSYFIKMAVKNCFIRGSVVRYVQIPAGGVDTQLLEDATRRG